MRREPGRRRTRRAVVVVLLALGAALGLAACGDTVGYSEGSGDRIRGQELFVSSCGSCHTLADAGTSGTGTRRSGKQRGNAALVAAHELRREQHRHRAAARVLSQDRGALEILLERGHARSRFANVDELARRARA